MTPPVVVEVVVVVVILIVIWAFFVDGKSVGAVEGKPAWGAGCKFVHSYGKSGMALDTEKRIVHVKSDGLEKSYPFADIRDWKYNVSSGGQVYGGGLAGLAAAAQNASDNKRSSGFYIRVRDIDHPQWRIAFPYNKGLEKELLRWMEIFSQHVNND